MKSLLVLLGLLLQTPTSTTYSISGNVVKFPDAAEKPSTLIMRSFALHEGWGQGKTTTIHADGTFEFTDVRPGEFDLNLYDARQSFLEVNQRPGNSPVSRNTAIGPGLNFTFSGHNVTGLQLKAPAELSGRFVITDGGSTPDVVVSSSTPLSVNSSFHSARSMRTQAVPGSDGRFTLGVFPGENTITVEALGYHSGSRALPNGYTVKSISYGDSDVMAKGLVLTGVPTSTMVITLGR
jgi:hypothetical protein